ncbi:MAG: diacylglycerol kinase family lipid kinase [Muribaculaceae bacterium]|nr:diacylglycerol kinase family lipid kinase [Muribaculaceae bacterium]
MAKHKILAIINPISGTSNKEYIPETIAKTIDSAQFDTRIRFTQRPGHATELAQQAINENFDGVIAVGGDGTINEVAAAIIDSKVALGIIPCGSGNGLARHLNIPLDPEKALEIVNDNYIESFDYCTANNRPFFCTCGIGFDAHISAKFAESKKRGPLTYFKKTLAEYLKYRSQEYTIETGDKVITEKAFVIACGNASQYGNNAFITPQANMQDGLIDVTVIHPFTPLDTAMIGILLFTKHIDQDTNIHSFRTNDLTIHRNKHGVMHLDGEPIVMDADVHIKCIHNGLNIYLPRNQETKKSLIAPIENGFWDFITTIRNELNI